MWDIICYTIYVSVENKYTKRATSSYLFTAEEQINDLRDEVLEEVRSFKDGIDSYVEEISKQSQDYLKVLILPYLFKIWYLAKYLF